MIVNHLCKDSAGPNLSALAAVLPGPAVVIPVLVRHVAPRPPTTSTAHGLGPRPIRPLVSLGLRWRFRCSNPVTLRLPRCAVCMT